jgi:hypothetical protein
MTEICVFSVSDIIRMSIQTLDNVSHLTNVRYIYYGPYWVVKRLVKECSRLLCIKDVIRVCEQFVPPDPTWYIEVAHMDKHTFTQIKWLLQVDLTDNDSAFKTSNGMTAGYVARNINNGAIIGFIHAYSYGIYEYHMNSKIVIDIIAIDTDIDDLASSQVVDDLIKTLATVYDTIPFCLDTAMCPKIEYMIKKYTNTIKYITNIFRV